MPLTTFAQGQAAARRLANTTEGLAALIRNDRAILLENSILDTAASLDLPIPARLRSVGDPGAYIVQCKGVPDQDFLDRIAQAGGSIVSYIPNNAYLVRADAAAAGQMARDRHVQALLPYEPYYKIKHSLLASILSEPFDGAPGEEQGSLSASSGRPMQLNVLLFPGPVEEIQSALVQVNATVLGQFTSPFGPVLTISCPSDSVCSLARLPGVQGLEFSRGPVPATDLGRVASAIATNSTTSFNYFGLSGVGGAVAVLDTGIDATHPDLAGRVTFDDLSGGTDTNGHGTHVASIIAGSGSASQTVTNAPGSAAPAVDCQFRGVAPGSILHSIPINGTNGPVPLEVCLERAAMATNTVVANSSWNYAGDNEYDLAAATCDAAARDALPNVSGPQALLCVVSAGNSGAGSADGTGGIADSIQSPGTAKNVITVGALEKNRFVTNETWTCSASDGCHTNRPWLLSTDSSNQVALFSSRGNVGIGTEGEHGRIKPDLVAQGTFVVAARSQEWNRTAYYAGSDNLFSESPDTNYVQVLSNLNESIGPFYRFESGTSLAAAEVSGAVALMHEFFSRVGRTNSPALMKALLINGARSVSGYDIGRAAITNSQGWGQLSLSTTIPACLTNATGPVNSMFVFDQDPSGALATGAGDTRCVDVKSGARSLPLRVTLVWTDPPANPAAAVKLVNDLDLVVTNLDTGEVFFGNDILPGSQFNRAWDPASETPRDGVNNVERVLLAPPLSGRYSVTVVGRRVGVNALSSSVSSPVQDYALVISSGDGEVAGALELEGQSSDTEAIPKVGVLTNQFDAASGSFGAVLWGERVGSGSPFLSSNNIPLGPNGTAALASGITNQWRFYVLENPTGFTNAAFATFFPPPLALRSTAESADVTAREADIDLYVSSDPGLLNLDPVAISAAVKSLGRGGAETIVVSNATAGFYYIGVKCESQLAAEYGLLAILSELPFGETDLEGRHLVRGVPAPALVPGPGTAAIFGLVPDSLMVRRVVVTNSIMHPAVTDLRGVLTHGPDAVVVHDHSGNAGPDFVYDQSGEGDLPWARGCDGPGSLADFGGSQGLGQWLFTVESTNQPGTNQSLWLSFDPQQDLAGGVNATILPGGCRRDFIHLVPSTIRLAAAANIMSGTGPVAFQLYPVGTKPEDCATLQIPGGASGTLVVDNTTTPPIRAGTYAVRLCNLGPDPVEATVACTTTLDSQPPPIREWVSAAPEPIPDDAVFSSGIDVTNREIVEAVNVGVRIEHARVSDLVLTLVSPSGQRVLLQENRGGASVEGMGGDTLVTNVTTVSWTGGPEAFTNVIEMGQSSGIALIDYQFWDLPDTMHVYYEGVLLFDSGLVRGGGNTEVQYGPGTSTSLTVVMNEGGNADTDTAWFYRVTSTQTVPVPVTFTENTNFTSVPIKFAPQPLTNFNYSAPGASSGSGIFYLPEQSLDALAGESALGKWRLEVADTKSGPPDAVPQLVSWRLDLLLRSLSPVPVTLHPGKSLDRLLAPREVLWLAVDVPPWVSFATNTLLSATLPVNLLFSVVPPGGGNPEPVPLLVASTGGAALLQTNGVPPLLPGSRYYLGVQNLSGSTVASALQVDFDVNNVTTLENGVPFVATSHDPASGTEFYHFVVSTNAARVQFDVTHPTENVSVFVRKSLPLPTAGQADYFSANPWTNDEMIVIYDYSTPVALTPGDWYLGVANLGPAPADYTVMATEFALHGTNLVITDQLVSDGTLCITWISLPGARYFVQGKVNLNDPDWVTVSPTITAVDFLTSCCVALASPFEFFRVSEGIVLLAPPLLINSVSSSASGVKLEWSASPGSLFKVEWSPDGVSPAWTPFTNTISSADGLFRFLDDGSQSGGFDQSRFYRLLKVR